MPKVLRLSEQYLIRAEAYVQSGKTAEAGKDITAIRAARYATYGGSTPMGDKENAMKVIEEERVKELYMEGFRLQDLKRWHKGFKREPQDQSLCSYGRYLSTNGMLRARKWNLMKVTNKTKNIQ